MAVRNILILTSSFPYDGGEQFIESEIRFWEQSKFNNIYILPNSQKGGIRNFPERIKLISNPNEKRFKLFYLIKALLSFVFFKELIFLVLNSNNKFYWRSYWAVLKTCANIVLQKEKIERAIVGLEGDFLVYSYWNDVTAYAACLLKRKGKVKQVVSRAHGADLYKERREYHYMPIKWQFSNDYNELFLLSDSALKYYSSNYGARNNILSVSRLGVDLPLKYPSYIFNPKKIRVLSISYCVPVKRIDKIIEALSQYAYLNSIEIEWTHIGGGDLFNSLGSRAKYLADEIPEFNFNFVGQVANADVKKMLQKNSYDIFINTSESEGIPVSIMEAMSYGIPAIAPDVGGITDLVKHKKNGYLMSQHSDISEIIDGIKYLHNESVAIQNRVNAREWILKEFNAEVNYLKFINKIENIAEM
ncbi:glycosyltransferase [Acinetobacter baumannii]